MPAALIVPAAGGGRRMGGAHKPLLELCGEPLLLHALRPFLDFPEIVQVVIALPASLAADPPAWLARLDPRIATVTGGAQRVDSVRAALATVDRAVDVVMVHDGARPLVTREVIAAALVAAAQGRSVIVGVEVSDTIQEVDAAGRIIATPDRARLRAAQTPQAFPRAVLVDAYAQAAADGIDGTDDAALVVRCGVPVDVIEGDAANLKVTTPADLEIAAVLLRLRA